jgi:hypothetical protein
MIRSVACGVFLCFLAAALPPGLFAQANPDGPNPPAPSGVSGLHPRVRRALREKVVAAVGPVARDFVEGDWGDDAVAALLACSRPVAVKLAEFNASGELDRLPRPRDLLRVIARRGNGDVVALYAIQHATELADADAFDAYLQNPLEYALALKPLAAGAEEAQSRREKGPAVVTPTPAASQGNDWQAVAAVAGGVILLALVVWRFRQRQGQ